jgi:hypothetical protein
MILQPDDLWAARKSLRWHCVHIFHVILPRVTGGFGGGAGYAIILKIRK